jgi:hypothetical protein
MTSHSHLKAREIDRLRAALSEACSIAEEALICTDADMMPIAKRRENGQRLDTIKRRAM